MTSLSSTAGTALRLSSTATKPPLTVSNSVQVPGLNASELDGKTSSAFLSSSGTAANSGELGGIPASGYMQGGGDTTGARVTLTGTNSFWFMRSPAANLYADCDFFGHGADLSIDSSTGEQSTATAMWWNKDGIGTFIPLNGAPALVTPVTTTPYVVVVQADNGSSISTFTASVWYDAGSDTCHFTAQLVTTSG